MAAWLKKNWYIPLFLAGVVTAFLIGRMPAKPADVTAVPGDAKTGAADANQQALRDQFAQAKAASDAREATVEQVKDTDTVIAEHQAKLETELPEEESAALLAALGNLHRQKKQDYATAARYYEELLQNYPAWPGVNGVYHQLISCYTELNDQESLRILYRKMLDVFPEESNEYEFAKHALDNP